MRAVCKLLINERNPPEGYFREKKFPQGTLLAPHKQRENPGPSKGRQSGQAAPPVQQAEQSRGAVASQGTEGESPLRPRELPAGERAVTVAFMAQCSSGLSQGPRPGRGGAQKRETATLHVLCGGTTTLAHACPGQLKALQTWDHAASQSSPHPGRSQSGLDY